MPWLSVRPPGGEGFAPARLAAGFAVAMALVVLLGWVLQVPGLKSVVPGAVQMKANTALGLLLAGTALGLRTLPGVARVAALGLSALLFILGGATLLQYLARVDFGIDEMLFRDTAQAFHAAPGRMSPFTAWSLLLLGVAIGVLERRSARWLVLLCAGQVLMVGGVGAVGYLWNASHIVTDQWLPPVALNTALTLAALAGGVFSLQRATDRGGPAFARRSRDAGLQLFFWGMVAVLLASTSFTYRSNIRFAAGAQEVERIQQARIGLADLRACLSADEGRDCRPLLDPLAGQLEGPQETTVFAQLRAVLAPAPASARPAEIQAERLDYALRHALQERRESLAQDRSAMLVSLLLTLAVCIGIVFVLSRNVRVALRRSALAREEVQRQQALLRGVLESSPDLIAYRDIEGHFLGCNAAYAELVGLPTDAIAGRTVDEVYDPAVAAQIRAQDAAVLRANEGAATEDAYRYPDGRRVRLEFVRSPMRDAQGVQIGVVAVGRDVTRRREAEDELRRARRLAEEATEMKAAFLANMSHEIRTPINAITGMSHLALKTELTPRQRDYITKVEAAGQHLVGVVDDILDFSKIEAGKLEIERAPFDLDALLEEVSGLIAGKAEARGLELVFDVDPAVPRQVRGDALRIRQVLINYLNNAVKFTESGEVVLQVRVDERAGDGMLLRFSVRDTGIGLTEDQAARMFQQFEQADASITRKYGGTGLGLAISRSLAELMGGSVGVHSRFGEGSTFWFTARLEVVQDAARGAVPWPDLRNVRALVADGNESARAALCRILSGLTFQVEAVATGAQALRQAREAAEAGAPFTFAFVDLHTADVDGITVARQLEELGLQPRPVVILTARHSDPEVGTAADGLLVLRKPPSASLVFDMALDALRGIRGGVPAAMARRPAPTHAPHGGVLRGRHLLLVEDNEVNQQVAGEILRDAGASVRVAGDGSLALRALEEESFELVLMDMQMPVMDGLTATRALRARGLAMPVIAITANAMATDRERCIAAGMNDFVSKPIHPQEMVQVVARWLGAPADGGPAAPAATQGAPAASAAAEDPSPAADLAAGRATEASAEPALARLAAVPGLAVGHGLEFIPQRDAAFYVEVLRQFAASYRDSGERLHQALAARDTAAAERLVHSCRGAAATLGALEVARLADSLEHTLRAGGDPQPDASAFAQALTALVAALDRALAD